MTTSKEYAYLEGNKHEAAIAIACRCGRTCYGECECGRVWHYEILPVLIHGLDSDAEALGQLRLA